MMTSILITLALLRYSFGVIDHNSGALATMTAGLIERLFGSIITTILVGAFLFYLTPESTDASQLEILGPHDLSPAFDEALGNASSWKFKGEFGRYFRTRTLPALSARASARHKTIAIVGLIMDPRDSELCQRHADFRNSVSTVDGRNDWTVELVQDQLYATILTTLIFQNRNTHLEIELYLLNHFVPVRIDLSSNVALITKEDRKAPAMKIRTGTFYFDSYEQEISVTKRQAHRVPSTTSGCTIEMIDPIKAKELLVGAGLFDLSLDNDRLSRICTLVKEKQNPYG